uniref:Uncharacterized protein n=1 Tax=Micrurus lemniscatus lemniscatus TaxID=129467 RepID=A0A2D4ICM0_MICLE
MVGEGVQWFKKVFLGRTEKSACLFLYTFWQDAQSETFLPSLPVTSPPVYKGDTGIESLLNRSDLAPYCVYWLAAALLDFKQSLSYFCTCLGSNPSNLNERN